MATKIQWCDETWNPVTGCTPAGPGCLNCYAKAMAERFWGDRKFSDVQFHADRLDKPFHWRKPRRIFVCSMGDLFHNDVHDYYINDVFRVIAFARDKKASTRHLGKTLKGAGHTFIILTKRPKRAREYIESRTKDDLAQMGLDARYLLDGVQIGVSVSTQADADKLIPELLDIPAATRIVSFEPALERIVLARHIGFGKIHGVIMGCESGPKRRYFNRDWARDVANSCEQWNVPFFLKQMPDSSGKVVEMPELDGKVWDQLPDGGGSLL